MKAISRNLESILDLAARDEYTVLKLTDYMGAEHYGTFTFNNNTELVIGLRNIVEQVGYGSYKVSLKKNATARDDAAVVYRFNYEDPAVQNRGTAVQTPQIDLAGIEEKFEQKIKTAVTEAEERARQRYEHQREVDELKRQIQELKGKEQPGQLEGVVRGLSPLLAGMMVKFWPETEPVITKIMDAEYEEVDDDEREQKRGFSQNG